MNLAQRGCVSLCLSFRTTSDCERLQPAAGRGGHRNSLLKSSHIHLRRQVTRR